MLRYYSDLSEHDIADALGISRGAVKSHASRGIRTLRTDPGGPVMTDRRPSTDRRPAEAHPRRRGATRSSQTPGGLQMIQQRTSSVAPRRGCSARSAPRRDRRRHHRGRRRQQRLRRASNPPPATQAPRPIRPRPTSLDADADARRQTRRVSPVRPGPATSATETPACSPSSHAVAAGRRRSPLSTPASPRAPDDPDYTTGWPAGVDGRHLRRSDNGRALERAVEPM